MKIHSIFKNSWVRYIVLGFGLLAIFFSVSIVRYVSKKEIGNYNFYQYLAGQKFHYRGHLSFNKQDEITHLFFDGTDTVLDSTPFYYEKEAKVLFPQDMSVVYPRSGGLQYKINYFSTIEQKDTSLYLVDHSLKKVLENCFLYDGKDTYFFLEETILSFQETEIKLSPFSYVVVKYQDRVEYYDYKNDRYVITPFSGENVLGRVNDYLINFSIDSIQYGEKSRLLMKELKFLKNLEA